MRSPRLVLPSLVVLLLAVATSSASAVIVHLEDGTTLSYLAAPGTTPPGAGVPPFDAFFKNLDYNGGPVMTSNTNYTLYWSPSGTGAYPAGFATGLNTYFTGLEHDSGDHQNVDSVASQYNNAAGEFAEYNSRFGGELLDTHSYPANGCTRAPTCLTDRQIKEELVRFISVEHLPVGLNTEYFVLTPEGVESCFEAAGLACSANAESHQAYCAYHGNIPLVGGAEIIYANDPFVNGKLCDETEHHINGPSDSALFGGLSHEHNESVTDPEPNSAWTDFGGSGEETGYEDGDKCRTFSPASEFGTPLGEVEVEGKKLTYNQEVNGRKYWYQQEWSNKGHTCLQRLAFEAAEAPNATFTSAAVAGNEVKFDAKGSTQGTGVRHTWQFNDSGEFEPKTIETTALTLNHVFPSAGAYTVALTVFKPDGTSKGVAKQVFVNEKSQSIKFESSSPGSAAVGGSSYSVSAKASSGLAVALSIEASSSSVCSISGATVSFIGMGTCTIDADQAGNSEWEPAPRAQQSFFVAKGSQAINFSSSAPGSAIFQGLTYAVSATASSGLAVSLTVDTSSAFVCSISGATVSFIGVGTCTIDANQSGNGNYEAAPQKQQAFLVGRGAQAIAFTSAAPGSATVGGPNYTVTAAGGESHNTVTFAIDAASASVCVISGATVSFIGAGTCTIDANEAGNANYSAALQVLQSFAVAAPTATTSTFSPAPALIPPLTAIPNSNFTGAAVVVSKATGAITFKESVPEPGTFSWLVIFQNGKFGAFASGNAKCQTGFIKLSGKCRPAKIVFAKGGKTVTAAGTVIVTLKPSASALKALKNALKQRKGLPVTATLTFQSSLGGSSVSHTQSLMVRLKKR